MANNKLFFFEELYLENFMSFKQKTFNFAKDISIIVGQNGTGKTSILEAIALSFQLKDRASSVLNYIRKGETKTKIVLKASWGGVPLSIESTFAKMGTKGQSKSHRTITYGKEVYEDSQAVNFLISFFDSKALTVSFAMQGNEKFLSTSKSTNLKNLLNLLQLDFSKAVKDSKKRLQVIVSDRDSITTELNSKIGARNALNEVMDGTEKDLESLKNQISQITIDENATKEKEKELNDLSEKLMSLELSLKKEDKQKLEEKKVYLAKLQKEYEEIESKIKNIHIGDFKDSAPLEEELKDLPEKMKAMKTEIENLQNEIREKTSKKSEVTTKIQIEKTKREKLSSGICPLCSQKVDSSVTIDLENKSKSLQEAFDEIEKSINKLISSQDSVRQDLFGLEKNFDSKKEELNAIKNNNQRIEYTKNLKKELEDSKKRTEENINNLRKEIEDLQIKVLEDQSEEKLKEVEKLKGDILRIKEDLNILKRKETTYAELKSRISFCDSNIEKTKANIEKTTELIDNLSAREKNVQVDIDTWLATIEIFNEIPKLHLKTFIQSLKDISSSIVRLFNYDGVEIDSDDDKGVDFLLVQGDFAIDYSMCSSFEKGLLSLSIVYTLCKFFSVPFVCIDELDSSADFENTRKLGELVKRIAAVSPVVTVSHDTSLVSDLIQSDADTSILRTDAKF